MFQDWRWAGWEVSPNTTKWGGNGMFFGQKVLQVIWVEIGLWVSVSVNEANFSTLVFWKMCRFGGCAQRRRICHFCVFRFQLRSNKYTDTCNQTSHVRTQIQASVTQLLRGIEQKLTPDDQAAVSSDGPSSQGDDFDNLDASQEPISSCDT